jgi:hypothetical protein
VKDVLAKWMFSDAVWYREHDSKLEFFEYVKLGGVNVKNSCFFGLCERKFVEDFLKNLKKIFLGSI